MEECRRIGATTSSLSPIQMLIFPQNSADQSRPHYWYFCQFPPAQSRGLITLWQLEQKYAWLQQDCVD
jgi:hypothetical protein